MRRIPVGEFGIPVALAVLGIFVLVESSRIAVPSSSNTVGPRAFPYAVGVLLVFSAAALIVSLARGVRGDADASEDVDTGAGTDWVTVAKLALSFGALVVLVEPLGWPLSAAVLFGGSAWALGARPIWRPAVVGLLLGVLTYLLFARFLGLFLPAGPLEAILGG